ncbi:FAD-dependent monooxygenase [Zavarzinia sp. CC-PAN008]|uniref:FAD-dependent monooxygenase n=1 Tax=Zavarzinia sp. CC-PAN008 TaxID=3243332 RepID=UPI003F744F96
MTQGYRTAVFIVGAGPVGMAMALLLERFGIDCVAVEKSPGTTDHPKSRGCWVRTMELFRQWGVEQAIRARGLPDGTDVFAFVESLAGEEYGRTRPEPDLGQTPAWKSLVAQDAVEEELLRALSGAAHARVLFGTEFLALAETDDGVTVRTRDAAGQEASWTCAYVVAADGAPSPTRRAAGIEMVGPATLAVMANEYWRGDLSRFPLAREAAGFFIMPKGGGPPSTILNTNGIDRWLTISRIGAERDERPAPWSDAEVVEIVRGQVGVPDLGVEILNRSTWRVSMQVAASFRKGRVLLVGDAAHRFPPTGGFGLNSGVQDAHNLAWKLAFVLKGLAAPRLLDTYDVERRPVAQSNAAFSFGNSGRFPLVAEAIASGNPDQIAFRINDVDNHLHSIGQALGFWYEAGAVIPDGTVAKGLNSRLYVPSDRPGSRFPHVWLDLARKRSTLDWFDRDFTLVAGPLGNDWLEAGRAVGQSLGLPLNLQTLPMPSPDQGFLMGLRGAVLVRPDGHVAWRMPWLPTDPARALGQALASLLN